MDKNKIIKNIFFTIILLFSIAIIQIIIFKIFFKIDNKIIKEEITQEAIILENQLENRSNNINSLDDIYNDECKEYLNLKPVWHKSSRKCFCYGENRDTNKVEIVECNNVNKNGYIKYKYEISMTFPYKKIDNKIEYKLYDNYEDKIILNKIKDRIKDMEINQKIKITIERIK